jgi:uncharacterized membrane protein YgdD (TMEM256/DUF423 family)
MNSDRMFFSIGAALAGTAVAAGAFGAHALKGRVDTELLEVFSTGARYQMFHALALLALAWAVTRWPEAGLELGGWLLMAGTAIFSGSLYLMTFTGVRWLGAITPIGGLLLIGGWAVLVWRTARAGATRPDES